MSIGLITALNTPSLPISSTPQAFAAANCEKANEDFNDQGNVRGNPKQCNPFGSDTQGPKVPVRDCNSPNNFKDNDGDGQATCTLRGR